MSIICRTTYEDRYAEVLLTTAFLPVLAGGLSAGPLGPDRLFDIRRCAARSRRRNDPLVPDVSLRRLRDTSWLTSGPLRSSALST